MATLKTKLPTPETFFFCSIALLLKLHIPVNPVKKGRHVKSLCKLHIIKLFWLMKAFELQNYKYLEKE
jgi:hypothetical protein